MKNFKSLGLSEKTLKALHKKGFEEPTEIQELTIPLLMENQIDIIAQAQTGTGKTAAFGLPLLEKLDPSKRYTQAIILAPTRELVIQVCEEINSLQYGDRLTAEPIYGGQSIEMQLRKLKRGVSIVVGTPGRVIDHLKRRSLDLSHVKFFILDEADEMLNMGFVEDIEIIFEKTPDEKRVLLFSATMPDVVKKLAKKYIKDFKHLKTKTQLTTNLTDQIYFEVSRQDKFEALCRIVDIEPEFYGLIFCRTRQDVNEVVEHLMDRGYSADCIHGDISQAQRERTLTKFRKQQISILVATDVAARGIDIDNLSHVINYSIPQDPEAYVHRIGRTGRAGKQGTAITFVTPAEFRKLGFIKRVTKTDIRRGTIPKVHDIINTKKEQITKNLQEILDSTDIFEYREWAKELIEDKEPSEVLSAFLNIHYSKILDEKNYRDIKEFNQKKSGNTSRGNTIRGNTRVEDTGRTRLFIARGKSSGLSKKDLVQFIVDKAGTDQQYIDNLELFDNFSFITVPFTEAEIILDAFSREKKGKRPIVQEASNKKSGDSKKKRRRSGR